MPPLVSIPVGVVVERRKATSPWLDFIWRPSSVLLGVPSTERWARLGGTDEAAAFYAGAAVIELYRTEAENYLSNLKSEVPKLWIVLRATNADPPYELIAVTADPAEGEAHTESGSDLVETVPMPDAIAQEVKAFVAEHHVARPFTKRQRDRADPEVFARRAAGWKDQTDE
jgi:hypothetical protein